MNLYMVNLWGSNPEYGNDDCHQGANYPTEEKAREVFETLKAGKVPDGWKVVCDFAFVELDGPTCYETWENPNYVETPDDRSAERQEARMQSAMAFGVQGWNNYED